MTEADAIVLLRDAVNNLAGSLSAVLTGLANVAIFAMLLFVPTFLTWAMFHSKNMMLGFPCAIFWAILGGYAYMESSATWDWEYLVFFAGFGMAIFSMFAAYGLRTKKEDLVEGGEFIDEGGDDMQFADESKPGGDEGEQEGAERPGKYTQGVRDRANRRRNSLKIRRENRGASI